MDTVTVANTAGDAMTWKIILPILTYIGGLLSFWFYDRKIKKHQLRQFRQDEIDSKKALVEANIISKGKGSYTLKIFNKGKSEARNVRIEYLNDEKGKVYDVMDNDIFPHSRLSQNNDHIDLNVIKFGAKKMNFNIIWDDNFESDRINHKSLTF